MREILFRGIPENRPLKSNYYVYGSLYISNHKSYEIASYNKDFDIERFSYLVHPESIGEYTGKDDINGNKIFENDRVVCHSSFLDMDIEGVVKFGEYKQPGDTEETSHVGFYIEWTKPDFTKHYRKDFGYWTDKEKSKNTIRVINE